MHQLMSDKFGENPYGEIKMTVDGKPAPGFDAETVLKDTAEQSEAVETKTAEKGADTKAEKSSVDVGKERVGKAKEWFKAKFHGAWEKVKAYGSSLKDDAELATYQVAGAPEAIIDAASRVGAKISETGSALKQGAVEKVSEAGAYVSGKASEAGEFVGRKVSEGSAAIRGDIESAIGSGREKINMVKDRCVEAYTGAKARVDGAKNAFNEKRNDLRDRAMSTVAGIREKIKNFQEINASIRKKREEIAALRQARAELLGFAH